MLGYLRSRSGGYSGMVIPEIARRASASWDPIPTLDRDSSTRPESMTQCVASGSVGSRSCEMEVFEGLTKPPSSVFSDTNPILGLLKHRSPCTRAPATIKRETDVPEPRDRGVPKI